MRKHILLLFLIVFLLPGCVSQKTLDTAIQEKDALQNNYNELKLNFEDLKKENEKLNKDNAKLKEKLLLYREEQNGQKDENNLNNTVEEEYINNLLVLYDFNAKYYDSFLDGKVPGVKFKLKNKGTKTLTRVEVTVYFYDDNGKPFAEEKYIPITSVAFDDKDKSLKPNYVWKIDDDHFYQAESVPKEWKSGNADYKITNIEFAE